MIRTTDGQLAILDFGLMTQITDDQKYGMVESIVHLINRDISEIGQDFINLDFIPEGTDTKPIVPALTKVFDVALAGGGAKSINFQELAADLADGLAALIRYAPEQWHLLQPNWPSDETV